MNKLLRLLLLFDIIIISVGAFMTPLWASFAQHIGGDLRTAGIAIGIFSIGGAAFTLFFATLEQKTRHFDIYINELKNIP